MCVENERRRYQRALSSTYALADAATRGYGERWYGEACDFAAGLADEHGCTVAQAAGCIAALSPMNHWSQNQSDTEQVCDWYFDRETTEPDWSLKRRIVAYNANVDKAIDCLGATCPLDVLGGPKVTAFYRNIMGDTDAVTVDVWITRAATRGARNQPTAREYREIAVALRREARRANMSPRDFQAAVWIVARGDA